MKDTLTNAGVKRLNISGDVVFYYNADTNEYRVFVSGQMVDGELITLLLLIYFLSLFDYYQAMQYKQSHFTFIMEIVLSSVTLTATLYSSSLDILAFSTDNKFIVRFYNTNFVKDFIIKPMN